MNTIKLLDTAKKLWSLESDYALAQRLGVKKQTVSTWRQGKAFPDEVTCAKLADITGLPLSRVLGIVGEERAISKEAKAVWRRLATAATVAALCVIPFSGNARARAFESSEVPGSVYYVN